LRYLRDYLEPFIVKAKKMEYEIYQEVALIKNISKTRFKKGDLCTVLKLLEEGKKTKLEVEFFSILGESIGIHQIPIDFVRHLSSNAIANMREL
jgi:hypothetical protein